MRTAADGWLTADRAGRRASWRLTASGVQLLTEGTERIYGFAAARSQWDGRWLMILVRTPESERPARHRLRTRLSWAGFGSPAPGIWLSPDASLQAEAERILAEAGLRDEAQIFLASHAGGGELAALARQAWDLDRIEQRYEQFIAEFSAAPADLNQPTRWPGLSSSCTRGAGSRGWIRRCWPRCCRPAGAGREPRPCSPISTPAGRPRRWRNGGASPSSADLAARRPSRCPKANNLSETAQSARRIRKGCRCDAQFIGPRARVPHGRSRRAGSGRGTHLAAAVGAAAAGATDPGRAGDGAAGDHRRAGVRHRLGRGAEREWPRASSPPA